jgi:hypothetical protein
VAVGVLVDDRDVGDGFAPGQLVGVVLVGAYEHHRPLVRRRAVRAAQLEDADQLVDRGSGP